ncbi:hypothetical protein FKW77_004960 [Venturia effusa]|uniref:Uncharacterized protein n=1 Tax=Venturia effusa TaxID=50376 RepID=A0A517KZF0_9PEZI|nr:hypothetical protein FKW77_004960 [Venturia effusa]
MDLAIPWWYHRYRKIANYRDRQDWAPRQHDKMKVSIAWSLLLPLVPPLAYGHTFPSARDYNICGHLYNIIIPNGEIKFTTITAACTGTTKMGLQCLHHESGLGYFKYGEYQCQEHDYCLPTTWKTMLGSDVKADAGCIPLKDPIGMKLSGDADDYACSSGFIVGDDPIYVKSVISTDHAVYLPYMQECTIIQSGTSKHIFSRAPCEQQSVLLQLNAKTTYQACVQMSYKLAAFAIGFTWHLRPPGIQARDLHHSKPLSEMFTIDNSTSTTSKVRFDIVIGDSEL